MLQQRFIDLSDYKPEDLVLTKIQGSILSISTTDSPTITVKGEHARTGAYELGAVDMTTLEKITNISGEGMFIVPILGVDKVQLEVSGTGTIYMKEI